MLQRPAKSEYSEKLGNCVEHSENDGFGSRFATWNPDWLENNMICAVSLDLVFPCLYACVLLLGSSLSYHFSSSLKDFYLGLGLALW